MQDTIIKGTGNSRTLASVPNLLTLYPTYEAFAQALINRELPIDIGPINPAGVNVHGTDLTKANILTADTETAIWGGSADRTPNQAFEKLRALITDTQNIANGKVRVQTGSYTGTGKVGYENQNHLYFSFAPIIVFIASTNDVMSGLFISGGVYGAGLGDRNWFRFGQTFQQNSTSLAWYQSTSNESDAWAQLNGKWKYIWYAFG